MFRTPLFCLCLLANTMIYAQFSYEFNHVEALSDTDWTGDLSHFMVNENDQLQLNAPEAGRSFIFHQTNIPDSLEIGFYFKMDFSPSANNRLRVYLQLDTTALEMANGYYVEIGENGTDDKISFARMLDGEALTIAEGTQGKFGASPAEAFLKVSRDDSGYWIIEMKTDQNQLFQTELEFFDSTIKRHFNQYFAIECIYTSTRADKFYFDDIYLSEIVPDTMPPVMEFADIESDHEISLLFNEVLDKDAAIQKTNFWLVEEDLYPDSVSFNEFKPNKIRLFFPLSFTDKKRYQLQISGISDLHGNLMPEDYFTTLHRSGKPLEGDLVINEILFNPFEDGEDFIELYNRSDKILSLNGLEIVNNDNDSGPVFIEESYDLFPGKFLAISKDTLNLAQHYVLPDTASLLRSKLPAFNNDQGNVSLYSTVDGQHILLDSFDYHEDLHFDLIDNSDGLSLERIFIDLDTNDPSNWQSSAAYTGGATPGYRNSQQLETKALTGKLFSISEKIFSPDNDGFNDVLAVNYQMPRSGFVANITVFNAAGYFVKKLINNQLLGTDGVIIWNGLNDEHKKSLIGPYILYCEVFHPDGEIHYQKLLAYLAEKL